MPAPPRAAANQPTGLVRRSTRTSTVLNQKVSVPNILGKAKSNLAASKKTTSSFVKNENPQEVNKRKAEKSPFIDKTLKRSAFVDITNAHEKTKNVDGKKTQKAAVQPVATSTTNRSKPLTTKAVVQPSVKPVRENVETKNFGVISKRKPLATSTNILPPVPVKNSAWKTSEKSKVKLNEKPNVHIVEKPTVAVVEKPKVPVVAKPTIPEKPKSPIDETLKVLLSVAKPTRRSIRLSDVLTSCSEESSLYVSASEEFNVTVDKTKLEQNGSHNLPPGVEDFDKKIGNDPNQLPQYAFEIFNYLKTRESKYNISDYMHKQKDLSRYMRSTLVDWMVEIQENFELTHETLYMAVKMVDTYLSKVVINRNKLQMVGAVSLFVASKFEERLPPSIDDFVYVCGDDTYKRDDMIRMEIELLESLDFDLGFPLSYRFLRRFARCVNIQMPLLTLARFILEYCLMDYFLIAKSDSKLAAAALHIARIMSTGETWSPTLEYFSGYKLNDFKDIAFLMNDIMHQKPKESLSTVRNKYSHETFFEVAKKPLVGNDKL